MVAASSTCTNTTPDAYLGRCQISRMEPLTVFTESSIVEV